MTTDTAGLVTEQEHNFQHVALVLHGKFGVQCGMNEAEMWLPIARAALSASLTSREGWKLVPVEPTDDMIVAGTEEWLCVRAKEDRAEVIWRAMLSAVPEECP